MSTLSINIPHFQCYLRERYLYNLRPPEVDLVYFPCIVFGVTSIPARAITFTCLLDNGAQVARLPISAFCWRPCDEQSLEVLELWDCFSYNIACVEYDYLKSTRVTTYLKDRQKYEGEYMFTLDWYGSKFAEEPGETGFKTAHILKLDNGNFAAQPNNRICWHDPSFVAKPYIDEDNKPNYLVNTHVWKCEGKTKWATEDSQGYFYE